MIHQGITRKHGNKVSGPVPSTWDDTWFGPYQTFSPDLRTSSSSSGYQFAKSLVGVTEGKHYLELQGGSTNFFVGVVNQDHIDNYANTQIPGSVATGRGIGGQNYGSLTKRWWNGSNSGLVWEGSAAIQPIILDADNRTMWMFENDGTEWLMGDHAILGTGPLFAVASKLGASAIINAGQVPFAYPHGAPPAGVILGLYG